jgi:beta-glucosidase
MSAYEVAAIEAKGVHVVMKHFALNDSEQDRIGLGVWISEQAAREVYLKAFQDAFEEGNAGGVMTAYTRWGAIWSGGNYGLMTGIMRNEWGSEGLTITDNVLTQYCNGVDAMMAGGVSTFDAMLNYVTEQLPNYENDAVIVTAMREACHHNLYAIANSVAMNGIGEDTQVIAKELKLVTITRMLMIIFIVLFIVSLVMFIIRKRNFKKSEAYLSYKEAKKK